ncbi:MAG TPA: hypothetical protein VL122_00630 [Nitrospirota bacterium]|nr:hypothetical protein [Nitrospirota bacterium]
MKWQALIVLLAIALSIIAPPSLPFLSDHGATTAIGALDICHSATAALSANGDMPCINEYYGHPLHLELYNISEIVNPLLKLSEISYQDEHPPQA